MEYAQWKQILHRKVLERLDYTKSLSDDEVKDAIDEVVLGDETAVLQPLPMLRKVKAELFSTLRGLDILQQYVEDSSVTEIMVNGLDNIFIERDGVLLRTDSAFAEKEKLQDVIQQIVAGCNRVVNESTPIVDARLANGARVNIVMEPVALNGPIVTIRRFPDKPITMQDLLTKQSVTEEAADFLEKLVRAKYNILISGGTGSGKTTFLNVLSGYIPKDERIITIEDSAELQLQGLNNLVRMETRNSNAEGCKEISIRDLIRTSLRMRPDRIVVGEVRGAEAVDMMQALNTGHDGSMSTAHANSATDLLFRLENMIMMGMEIPLDAIRRQIASGVDIIVHLSRMRDKSRRVEEIREVTGFANGEIRTRQLFCFVEQDAGDTSKVVGSLCRKEALMHVDKLEKAGLSPGG